MEKRKAEIRNFVCLHCRNKFFLDTYDEGLYGIWRLRCNKCGRGAVVNTFKDAIWEKVSEELEKKHGKITNEDYNCYRNKHPQIIELEKRFEETCDPCPCNGRFEVRAKERCPKCFSNNVKELRASITTEDMVPDNRIRITHTQWEKEHGK